ncbi:MAG: hypothetical protein ACE15C_01935 [Phycisphaerae bacterium]
MLARILLVVCLTASAAWAEEPAVVCNVKVLSDKVKDVSSLEAWRKAYIREGMSDRDKAVACWETVASFQHQDEPPVEYLQQLDGVTDAVKMFNVYGYAMCGQAANHVAELARYVGLKARVQNIAAHLVCEVEWDGKWHMLDASLINYFPKDDKGKASSDLASVQEISDAVKAWLDANADYKKNDKKLREFQRADDWTGWRKGPPLLAACPFYSEQGWLPAGTHGWYSTMQEYDGSRLAVYESGYSMGYKVNIQLRPGEKLIRNWSNKGLHVNQGTKNSPPGCLKLTTGKDNLRYTPAFGDLAPGRVGNGTLEYDPQFDTALPRNALRCENLKIEPGGQIFLRVADASKPGVLEIRMPSSYVYLAGSLRLNGFVEKGESVSVLLSDNNGLDWQSLGKFEGGERQPFDLTNYIRRRYDYRLRLVFNGNVSLCAMRLTHDIQHSQRPLPALDKGENTITLSAGPQEGTITVEGSSDVKVKDKQLVYTDFHPTANDIEEPLIKVKGETGDLTYTVDTPADMVRLGVFTHYRARAKNGGWDVQVSFDGGKSFKTVSQCRGPTPADGNYVIVADVPAGTRSARVRWSGRSDNNATMIFNHRIDADYKMPAAGFRPVKVTYAWEEGGIPKTDEHVARSADETWKITCNEKPVMKSITLELAK